MPIVLVEQEKLNFTNLDKYIWPEDKVTKADLINYYVQVSEYILPHLENRPMVFTRYPNGIAGKAFYQKNLPAYAPSWMDTYTEISLSTGRAKKINYALINDLKSLLWSANQACLELHPWLSSIDNLDCPKAAVFDLDPMEETDFEDVRKIALALKELLLLEGLKGFPKTSGATGLQVYVPLVPKYTYQEVRSFAYFFCRVLEITFPQIVTTERKIIDRKGKLYLDYLQNIKGKTIIAPYSPRPRKGAPVSCPLEWEELSNGVTPDMFTLKSMPQRLKYKGDVFYEVLTCQQKIDKWIN
ncbi:non-homologous end-joining DNA ligase [Bacillota bacterium LX-D]|nr:non-homologous end-joining DNA ligase [Bacillota bacterium LX-D]